MIAIRPIAETRRHGSTAHGAAAAAIGETGLPSVACRSRRARLPGNRAGQFGRPGAEAAGKRARLMHYSATCPTRKAATMQCLHEFLPASTLPARTPAAGGGRPLSTHRTGA